jgi:sulfur dioxygenase
MIFRQLFDPETSTYTYLLADAVSREAVLIDPVMEQVERDLRLLSELDVQLVYCLDTHVHADHVTGAGTLRTRTGCKTAVCATAGVSCADMALDDGDVIAFGSHTIEVRCTPGHTNGCVTYVVDDGTQIRAFTGDALFIRGCGRTDFQQGDPATLYRSVHAQIFSLPDSALILPGHDYKGHHSSTVAEEKQHNPRLNTAISQDAFVEIMEGLNLDNPKKIDVAVPANLGCGLANEAEQPQDRLVAELGPNQIDDLGTYRLVDVREPHEWVSELGHIQTATLLPQGQVIEASVDWPKDETYLIICRSGRRSRNICESMMDQGFTDVTNLKGGMMAWNEQHGKPSS